MTTSIRLLGGAVVLAWSLLGFQQSEPAGWWAGPNQLPTRPDRIGLLVSKPNDYQRQTMQRIAFRAQLVAQLQQQEKSLFEVAALFQLLDEESSITPNLDQYPGACRNEKVCRRVILWAKNQIDSKGHESEALELQQRLERELQQHIAQHGKVILPTW
jgi:hypothetical protein